MIQLEFMRAVQVSGGKDLIVMLSKQQGRPFLATENADDLETLRGLAESESIVPVIDRTFPLDEAVEAIAFVGEGHNQGTSIIAM